MEKIDKFLKISKKTLKKRRLINASKQKTNMAKSNHKTVVISTLDNSEKESLQISILETKISKLGIKKVNITIISIDAYQILCKLKEAWVFVVSIRDLKY